MTRLFKDISLICLSQRKQFTIHSSFMIIEKNILFQMKSLAIVAVWTLDHVAALKLLSKFFLDNKKIG